jgi:hypothetical protein
MSKYILNILQNIKTHCVFTYLFGSLPTRSNTHCQLSVYDLNLLGSVKCSPAISHTTFFFYWRYNLLWVCILQPSSGAIASSRTRFLDHTERRATVGRTPLDEWSVRRRDLYLTTHNTHNRQNTKTDRFCTTKPPTHPEDGERNSTCNVGKTWHPDAAVCLRKFHWILSPRKLRDLHYDTVL